MLIYHPFLQGAEDLRAAWVEEYARVLDTYSETDVRSSLQ